MVLEFSIAFDACLFSIHILAALSVKTDPFKTWSEVIRRNGIKTLESVNISDALSDSNASVFGLDLFVVVEGFATIYSPLSLGFRFATRPRAPTGSAPTPCAATCASASPLGAGSATLRSALTGSLRARRISGSCCRRIFRPSVSSVSRAILGGIINAGSRGIGLSCFVG